MGSNLRDLPSFNPHNFTQLRPCEPSNPSKMTPITFLPTYSRAMPPPDQVITTEARNVLLRNIYERAEEKIKIKRTAPDYLVPDHSCKLQRTSSTS